MKKADLKSINLFILIAFLFFGCTKENNPNTIQIHNDDIDNNVWSHIYDIEDIAGSDISADSDWG